MGGIGRRSTEALPNWTVSKSEICNADWNTPTVTNYLTLFLRSLVELFCDSYTVYQERRRLVSFYYCRRFPWDKASPPQTLHRLLQKPFPQAHVCSLVSVCVHRVGRCCIGCTLCIVNNPASWWALYCHRYNVSPEPSCMCHMLCGHWGWRRLIWNSIGLDVLRWGQRRQMWL